MGSRLSNGALAFSAFVHAVAPVVLDKARRTS